MSREPRKALEILLKRVIRQMNVYKMIHKIGGFRKNKTKNSKAD